MRSAKTVGVRVGTCVDSCVVAGIAEGVAVGIGVGIGAESVRIGREGEGVASALQPFAARANPAKVIMFIRDTRRFMVTLS
jgi:hypothetical protein